MNVSHRYSHFKEGCETLKHPLGQAGELVVVQETLKGVNESKGQSIKGSTRMYNTRILHQSCVQWQKKTNRPGVRQHRHRLQIPEAKDCLLINIRGTTEAIERYDNRGDRPFKLWKIADMIKVRI